MPGPSYHIHTDVHAYCSLPSQLVIHWRLDKSLSCLVSINVGLSHDLRVITDHRLMIGYLGVFSDTQAGTVFSESMWLSCSESGFILVHASATETRFFSFCLSKMAAHHIVVQFKATSVERIRQVNHRLLVSFKSPTVVTQLRIETVFPYNVGTNYKKCVCTFLIHRTYTLV